MKKYLPLLLFFPIDLLAQPVAKPCYDTFRDTGIIYMNRKDYGEAISQFVAALVTCKDVPAANDLGWRIEECKRKWANEQKEVVDAAQKSYNEAVLAREAAVSARTAEAAAREQAEENARNAFKRGVRAESFRLALLADMARQRGHRSDALLLSWLGIQMSDTLQPYLMNAFAAAVRDSFTTAFFSSSDPITALEYLSDGNFVLLKTAAQRYFIVNSSGAASVVQLPAEYAQVVSAAQAPYLLTWNKDLAFVLNSNGKIEATLKGHSESIVKAVFSRDGKQILTCSRDNTARIYDLNGTVTAELRGHTGNVQSGAFSADAAFVLTTSADGSARVWDVKGNERAVLRDSNSFVTRAFFSASNLVFSLQSDGHLLIWAPDGKPITAFGSKQEKYWGLRASPDGKNFLAGISDDKIQIIRSNGEKVALLPHKTAVTGFSFSSDGQSILSWTSDHVIWRWDLTGKLLQSFTGHRQHVQHADFNQNLNLLLSTAVDGNYKIWDAQANINAEWESLAPMPANACFSPSLTQVLSIGNGGKSAMQTPIPKEIFAQIELAPTLKSEALKRVKAVYDIQFLESLSPH